MSAQAIFRGERLRLIRQAHNLNQDEMAVRLNIGRPQVSNLERGYGEVSVETLVMICMEFEVSADWLLGLTGSPPEWMQIEERTITVVTVARKAHLSDGS